MITTKFPVLRLWSMALYLLYVEQSAASPVPWMSMNATCVNFMKVYADGIEQAAGPYANTWHISDTHIIPADTSVVGIECRSEGGEHGIMASFGDGTVTDSSWQCSNVLYDGWSSPGAVLDDTWNSATTYGTNESPGYDGLSTVDDIDQNSNWIWTNNPDSTVYCRKTFWASTNPTQTGHDCTDNGPCTLANTQDYGFYYPHILPDKYIQCSAFGTCYEMPCAPTTVWSQAAKTCILGGSGGSGVHQPCDGRPCLNGGWCENNVDAPQGFECHCPDGFTGTFCQDEFSVCNPNPCHNSGTCTEYGDHFICHCLPGYTGELCEYDIESLCTNYTGDATVSPPVTDSYGHHTISEYVIDPDFYQDLEYGSDITPSTGSVQWVSEPTGASSPGICDSRGVLRLTPPSDINEINIYYELEDVAGWTAHIADDRTCNGWGGASPSVADENLGWVAEMHSLDLHLQWWENVAWQDGAGRPPVPLTLNYGYFEAHGRFVWHIKITRCTLVEVETFPDMRGTRMYTKDNHMFKWGRDKYLGINRVTGTSSRFGTGACAVAVKYVTGDEPSHCYASNYNYCGSSTSLPSLPGEPELRRNPLPESVEPAQEEPQRNFVKGAIEIPEDFETPDEIPVAK